MKRRIYSLIVLCTSLVLNACGSRGQGGGNQDGGKDGTGPGAQPTATRVSGSFYLGDLAHPASGLEIWMFDHSAPNLLTQRLAGDGSFSIPVEQFVVEHTYSLHLITDGRLIADIDVSALNAGVQAAFIYHGGVGFDLGQVVVPVDRYGAPDGAAAPVSATLGGGFGLSGAATGAFASYPLPTAVSSLQMGSQLYVTDPEILLNSFYRRSLHPDAYARDLANLSRLGFGLMTAADNVVARAWLGTAGSWLGSARLPASDDASPGSAGLWQANDNAFSGVDAAHFGASVFSGGLPQAQQVAVVEVRPTTGSLSAVPVLLPRVVGFPPKVTAVSGSGGSATAIDYSAPTTTTANGLNLPICQSGPVVIDVNPPLTPEGLVIPSTLLHYIDVVFDYYTNSGGHPTHIDVTPAMFAAPYSAAVDNANLANMERLWDPAQQSLRFLLTGPVAAAASQELQIWPELFPATVGGTATAYIRLKIFYRTDSEATAAGTVLWLKTGC